ncbi:hypothetical protein KW782_02320 [Candidatus Parcubacteria bacterium]|nr:hypothetical protein [Candidatus Parcubacteria bacterium]
MLILPVLTIPFDPKAPFSNHELRRSWGSVTVQEDQGYSAGLYLIWMEPVLVPSDYGDPEKRKRPKFIPMAEIKRRVDQSDALTFAFANMLFRNTEYLECLDPRRENLLIFPKTRVIDQYGNRDYAPFVCLNSVTRVWSLYFHHIQHLNTPLAHFVCGINLSCLT